MTISKRFSEIRSDQQVDLYDCTKTERFGSEIQSVSSPVKVTVFKFSEIQVPVPVPVFISCLRFQNRYFSALVPDMI